MIYLTTFFDRNYLSRGLVLYESIKEFTGQFELHVLCLDNFTLQYFDSNKSQYPEITPISLETLEENDNELRECKRNRSKIEYYFTISPCLPLYLLKKNNFPHICSMDADILFLADLKPLFDYLDKFSIVATPHKFSPEFKYKEELYGIFNVSFQVFKNDAIGIECLSRWRSQCIDWCGDYEDTQNKRFADQKYLDEWPELYGNKLKILADDITGLASWNLNNYHIRKDKVGFYSNEKRIIFYHFDAFKFFNSRIATNGFGDLKIMKPTGVNELYIYYWKKLSKYNQILSLKEDSSTRRKNSGNILIRILNESSIFWRVGNQRIVVINYRWMPQFVRNISVKLIKSLFN